MKTFYTYLHCKPNGEPFYVGKGSNGYRRRSHDFNNNRNKIHRDVVSKYGRSAILIFVFPCDSEDQAFADEIQQIAQLRSEGYFLANISDGGGGPSGMKHSQETRDVISKKLKGRKLTAAHCAKIGNAHKGSSYSLGRTHSAETKIKMAESARHRDESVRVKMSIAATGRTPSEATRLKLSIAAKNRSPSHREKLATARKGRPPSDLARKRAGDAARGRIDSELTTIRRSVSYATAWAIRLNRPMSFIINKNA